ncbi:hypothetical protein CBR_g17035 [Chara braunii]|uniref:alpha-amylase n=1 Tax=Chara braunii TaxID=69332 RepID=A0A388KUS0_CHABU|nr:hypothetical protein CBR_g17035 [Chara braunii]|eukprot:GBG73693.1 hypothetical protein CBR_g17035 [Chara braunii]
MGNGSKRYGSNNLHFAAVCEKGSGGLVTLPHLGGRLRGVGGARSGGHSDDGGDHSTSPRAAASAASAADGLLIVLSALADTQPAGQSQIEWPGDDQVQTTLQKDYALTRRVKVRGKLWVKVALWENLHRIRISVECDVLHRALLHWGVTTREEAGRQWTQPPKKIRPPGTVKYKDYAARTPLRSCYGAVSDGGEEHGGGRVGVDLEIAEEGAPEVIAFVLKDEETGRWHDKAGGNFIINLADLLEQRHERKTPAAAAHAAGGLRLLDGGAVGLLEETHDLENEVDIGNRLSAMVGLAEGGDVKVLLSTDLSGPVLLHWGLVKRGEEQSKWTVPAKRFLPSNSTVYKKRAVQTVMKRDEGCDGDGEGSWIMVDVGGGFSELRFVLKEVDSNTWFDAEGEDFSMPLPAAKGPKDHGGGQEGAAAGAPGQTTSGVAASDDRDRDRNRKKTDIARLEAKVAEPVLPIPIADMAEGGGIGVNGAPAAANVVSSSSATREDFAGTIAPPAPPSPPPSPPSPSSPSPSPSTTEVAEEEVNLAAITRSAKGTGAVPAGTVSSNSRVVITSSGPGPEELLQEIDRLAAEASENFRRATVIAPAAPLSQQKLEQADSKPTTTLPLTSPQNVLPLPLPLSVPDRQPCPGTGSGKEILLQGFNWESHKTGRWYNIIAEQAADIASGGFTAIWLPPPTDSISPEGYMPRDLYDLNSKYGDMEALKRVVKRLHEVGMVVLGDAVLNHRCAHFQGPNGVWNRFGGKLAWDNRAIVCDDAHFDGAGNRSSGDSFHAAPNIDHSQGFVRKDITEWLQWLRMEIGYDGWRLDFVRGFWGGHVKEYIEGSNPWFAVGEYWDSLSYTYGEMDYNQDAHRQRIIDWMNATGGNAGAFDVTTKGILHTAIEKCEYWRLTDSERKPPGVVGWWPSRAVTFIENHDSGSTQGHWRFPQGREMLGYAYILTHPGTPTVFYDHWFANHLKEPIRILLALRRRQGIHCRSVVRIQKAEKEVYGACIDEKVCMKIGPGHFDPPCDETKTWVCVLEGQDFKVWEVSHN